MRSWLVISNCQTLGLANSLALQNPSVLVQPIDAVAYARDKAKLDKQLGKYEFVFVNDQLYGDRPNSFSSAPNVIVVPHIVFDGYHPDLAYVRIENGDFLRSPLGAVRPEGEGRLQARHRPLCEEPAARPPPARRGPRRPGAPPQTLSAFTWEAGTRP